VQQPTQIGVDLALVARTKRSSLPVVNTRSGACSAMASSIVARHESVMSLASIFGLVGLAAASPQSFLTTLDPATEVI